MDHHTFSLSSGLHDSSLLHIIWTHICCNSVATPLCVELLSLTSALSRGSADYHVHFVQAGLTVITNEPFERLKCHIRVLCECVNLNATAGIEVTRLLWALQQTLAVLCCWCLMGSHRRVQAHWDPVAPPLPQNRPCSDSVSLSFCRLTLRGHQNASSHRSARWWRTSDLYNFLTINPQTLLSRRSICADLLSPPPSLETSLHTVTHSLNCMSPKVKPLSAFHTDEAPGFITFYFTCIVSLTSTSIYAADCRSEQITVLNKKHGLLWLRACFSWMWKLANRRNIEFPPRCRGNVSVFSCSHAQQHALYRNKHAKLQSRFTAFCASIKEQRRII